MTTLTGVSEWDVSAIQDQARLPAQTSRDNLHTLRSVQVNRPTKKARPHRAPVSQPADATCTLCEVCKSMHRGERPKSRPRCVSGSADC